MATNRPPEITPALVRQIIELVTYRNRADPAALMYELYDAFAERVLAELHQGADRHTPTWEDVYDELKGLVPDRIIKKFIDHTNALGMAHAEAEMAAFICGMLAASPGAFLLGQAPAMVQALGARVGGKDQ